MILDEDAPVDGDDVGEHRVHIAIQGSITNGKQRSKEIDYQYFFSLFTSDSESSEERQKKAIQFLKHHNLSESFLSLRGGIRGYTFRYDQVYYEGEAFQECLCDSEELNVFQLACFFEMEQLSYYILNTHAVQVPGKYDRSLDHRYFLTAIPKDENDLTFNLRLAMKHNLQSTYNQYINTLSAFWRSEHILIALKYAAKHLGNKDILENILSNYKIQTLFAQQGYAAQYSFCYVIENLDENLITSERKVELQTYTYTAKAPEHEYSDRHIFYEHIRRDDSSVIANNSDFNPSWSELRPNDINEGTNILQVSEDGVYLRDQDLNTLNYSIYHNSVECFKAHLEKIYNITPDWFGRSTIFYAHGTTYTLST